MAINEVAAAAPQGLRERLALYMYGNANLCGSLAGLAGLGLYFGGIIEQGWLLIVAGLYACGALLAPRPAASGVKLDESLSIAEIGARLDLLVAAVRGTVDDPILHQVQGLRDILTELLPKLVPGGTVSTVNPADPDVFEMRQIVFRYLPQTIDAYLRLPRLYRQHHALREGKTAETLFGEQIALLTRQVDETGRRLFAAEAQALLAQGRFLGDKFRPPADFVAVPQAGGDMPASRERGTGSPDHA